jgi:hypothetical protein
MRKILGGIVLLLVVGFAAEVVTFDNTWGKNPLFNVVSETPASVEVIFSIHKMIVNETIIDGMMMKTYGLPGIFLPNDEGAPNLAGTGRYIAIPQGSNARATIINSRTTVYHNIEVAPAPVIPRDTDDSPLRYEKDIEIYNRDDYYPEAPVKLSQPMKMRGVDVVILGITPFQYNPVTKDLIVYQDLRVRVDFIGGNGHFGEDRLRNRFWEPILQGHILNYNSLPKIDFYHHTRSDSGWEYIIIIPDETVDPIEPQPRGDTVVMRPFKFWADSIKYWRNLQGISTEVFSVRQVGGNDADAIEEFLDNAYNNWDPAPVAFLILGDYAEGKLGVTSPHYIYYTHMGHSDNVWADVDEDGLPDMHHGRICARNQRELKKMIRKFFRYERQPYTASNFYDNPLISCAWETIRWFQICAEVIRGFFMNSLGKNPVRQYKRWWESGNHPYPGCPWSVATNTDVVVQYWYDVGWLPDTLNPYDEDWWDSGSADGINDAINSGAFLAIHRDHGAWYGWGSPEYYIEDLDGLTNSMLPFVYSINCATGAYDWSLWNDECFIEKMHRMNHGALGANAPIEDTYSFVNDTYVWGMFDGLWQDFMPDYPGHDTMSSDYDDLRPCMAMTYGKYFLEISSWPYNQYEKDETYHVYQHHGDVFTPLYTEMPQNLAVYHEDYIPAGQAFFRVTANNGSLIALTLNGEIIGVGEGTGGPVDIPIFPQSGNKHVIVTVTKANYYRYEATVDILNEADPFPVRNCPGKISDDMQAPLKTQLTALYPNPFKDKLCITYQLAQEVYSTQSSGVSIKIYDCSGTLVRQFDDLAHQPFNQIFWDGNDNRGRRLFGGVYFVYFAVPAAENKNYERVEKVILLR